MKPSNIIAGRKYKHSKFPNFTYLGVSIPKFRVCNSHYKSKSVNHLIILEKGGGVLRPGQIGKGGKEFWNKFSLVD